MNDDPLNMHKIDQKRVKKDENRAAYNVIGVIAGVAVSGMFIFGSSDEAPTDATGHAAETPTSTALTATASPAPRETLADRTLADYAALPVDRRADLVTTQIAIAGAPADTRQAFLDCMGNHSVFKDGDLSAGDVFGWCDADRQQNPDRFAAFFNELTAADLRGTAITMCQAQIRAALRNPDTADFPWLPNAVRYLGAHRYVVNSWVEADTIRGDTARLSTTCDLQFDGGDDTASPSSWTFYALDLT